MVVVEMARFGIPWPVILVVLLLMWTENIHHGPVNFVEYFAGVGEQTQALVQHGLIGHAHDLDYGCNLR